MLLLLIVTSVFGGDRCVDKHWGVRRLVPLTLFRDYFLRLFLLHFL